MDMNAKSTKASLKQPRRSRQKNKKTNHQTQEVIIIEPNNTLEISLSNAASDTSIIRSLDASDANIIFYQQLIDGLKRSLEQNKEIFKAIHETKNLASRICKIQLPLLGLFPDDIEFKKCVEGTLEQEKPGYVERHESQ
ncbi:unnamed protein product [Rhizophagus irregularis]|nr:unnamed protein product [Rhizophagus irregularis]